MHYPDYASLAGAGANFNKDLWLTFNSNGTVTYRLGTKNNAGQDSTNYGAHQQQWLYQLLPLMELFILIKKIFIYREL